MRQSLTEALEELERTDPAVKRAADNYRRTVDRLLAEHRAAIDAGIRHGSTNGNGHKPGNSVDA